MKKSIANTNFKGWVGNCPANFCVDSNVIIVDYEIENLRKRMVEFPNGSLVFREQIRNYR